MHANILELLSNNQLLYYLLKLFDANMLTCTNNQIIKLKIISLVNAHELETSRENLLFLSPTVQLFIPLSNCIYVYMYIYE